MPMDDPHCCTRLLNGDSQHRSRRPSHGSIAMLVFSTAVVAMGPVQFGFCTGYTSPTQTAITASLNLTTAQFSLFGSLSNIGAMLGALLCGLLADSLGRRKSLIAAAIPNIAGWIAISASQDVVILCVGRLLAGFGVGIISFSVPIYIAEIAPKHLRGLLGTVNQLSITVGIFITYLLGIWLSWRILALIGMVPCAVLLGGIVLIPESPRWLAKTGREEEFTEALKTFRGKNYDIHEELEIKEAVRALNEQPRVRFSDLTQRKYLKPLIVGIGLLTLQQLVGINALLFYSTSIFESAGVSAGTLASLALAALQIFMTGVSAILIDRAGRRLLLMVSSGGMCVSCFLVGLSYYLQEHGDDSLQTFVGIMALVSLLVYIICFSLGLGAIPWVIMSEVFPSNVKGMAGSIATLVNWFFGGVVTLTFNSMLDWSASGSFVIFAGGCLVTLLFVAFLVPETKGKTLEEIQESFLGVRDRDGDELIK